ncbi:unnamed protein product, partial [Brassica napus]
IERDVDEDDVLGGWDKDFLDAAFKAEEILLSTQVPPPAPPIVPPSVPASERKRVFVFRSLVKQHDFNFTYKLESGSNGQVFTVAVAPGDVIIAGTDGLFDNLYNNEITATVVQAVRAGTDPQVTAQKIAALARQRAQDKNRQTPFSTAAQDAGFRYYGGKLDDIVWSQDTHVTTKKTVACDTNEQQSDPISVPGHVRLNVAAPRIKMLFD